VSLRIPHRHVPDADSDQPGVRTGAGHARAVVGTADHAIPLALQLAMANTADARG
jgi:hypothetical protein